MGTSFLITVREGLEVSLVLAILVSYLVKADRRRDVPSVWRGTAAAIALCVVVGVIVNAAVGGLNGTVEQVVEGSIAVTSAAVLTWMIFWMRANARMLGADLRGRVDAANSAGALMAVAFVATVREGLETVLFLLSAETGTSSGGEVVVGGVAGLVVAIILGWVAYKGGNRMNLRRFFQATGILLILFAAGLVGKAFHEFREALDFHSGGLIDPAWTIVSGPFAQGTLYDFLKGFFGWHNETEWIRLIAYFAYLLPVMWLFVRRSSPSRVEG